MSTFTENCYGNMVFEKFIIGVELEDRELTLFSGSTSKLYCLMGREKKYKVYQHMLRYASNLREPYEFMWFCIHHIDVSKYDIINIIIEERELEGCWSMVANRTMRLKDIERMIVDSGEHFENYIDYVDWLKKNLNMSDSIALQTYKCLLDWSSDSFCCIIEWKEVEIKEPIKKINSRGKTLVNMIVDGFKKIF